MNTNEIARNFYFQKRVSSRFITAKQCSWLMRTADYDKQSFRGLGEGRGSAKGDFTIDGKRYGWELHVIKGGAGSFSVTTPEELDAFHQELVQREKDRKSTLFLLALDEMQDADWPALHFGHYITRGAIYESDWLS